LEKNKFSEQFDWDIDGIDAAWAQRFVGKQFCEIIMKEGELDPKTASVGMSLLYENIPKKNKDGSIRWASRGVHMRTILDSIDVYGRFSSKKASSTIMYALESRGYVEPTKDKYRLKTYIMNGYKRDFLNEFKH
jgi:hypothetical protein